MVLVDKAKHHRLVYFAVDRPMPLFCIWIRVLLRHGWVQKHWVFPPLLAIDDAPIVSRLLQPVCLRASAIRMTPAKPKSPHSMRRCFFTTG